MELISSPTFEYIHRSSLLDPSWRSEGNWRGLVCSSLEIHLASQLSSHGRAPRRPVRRSSACQGDLDMTLPAVVIVIHTNELNESRMVESRCDGGLEKPHVG